MNEVETAAVNKPPVFESLKFYCISRDSRSQFVFSSIFRSLQCSRITIHKNLVVSFLLRFIVNIIIVEPYISHRETSYRDFVSITNYK